MAISVDDAIKRLKEKGIKAEKIDGKKEKLPKEAIGWVDGLGSSQPQLKIYHKKMVYIADLQWS